MNSPNPNCSICLLPKAHLKCGLCSGAICKKCAHPLSEAQFAFLEVIPEVLTHGTYCSQCFDDKVVPELESYDSALARAKNVSVYYKKQSKETRLFKRKERPLQVTDCADRDEAILRLAFLAAKANYNTLIDVEVRAEKVRYAGYQTSKWHAVGIPVQGKG